MQPWMTDVPAAIVRVKAELRKSVPDVEARDPIEWERAMAARSPAVDTAGNAE